MISIIIPIYNAEKFLHEAIESIMNQSYQNFELILVNDGSTDSSDAICAAYAQKYQNIRHFKKENSGVSDTRNFGMRQATGEFLVFVDADDTLPPNALQNYMDEMTIHDADVIFSGYSYNYNGKLLPKLPRIRNGIYTYQELKPRLLDDGTLSGILFGSVCGAFYKRSYIMDYHIEFSKNVKVNEDGLFNLNILFYCNKIQVIHTICYHYRQWKKQNVDKLQKDLRFDNCNREIMVLLEKRKETDEFKVQLQCRQTSIAFWNAIRVKEAGTGYKEAKMYLTDLFTENSVQAGLKELNYSKMNRYKRVVCKLIKGNSTFLFYLLFRYIVPRIEHLLKR